MPVTQTRFHTRIPLLLAALVALLALSLAALVPTADAQRKRGKKRAAPATYIYALCGPNVCRIDAKTRKSKIVLRRSTDSEYTAVSASPRGSTLAFVYDGDVFRSGRDGRGRRELDQVGSRPNGLSVSPNGRSVSWFATINTTQCVFNFYTGGCDIFPVTYVNLYSQSLSDREAESYGPPDATAGWYRNELMAQADPEEGEADYICVIDDEGDCTRTVAQDLTRAYSSPSTSPDGRYLAVVSEPAPPEDGDMDYQGRIEIWNAATGRKIRNLTDGTKDETPIFSPDGKTVAFNRGKDLLTRSVRGGKPKLIKRDVRLTGPSWARGK